MCHQEFHSAPSFRRIPRQRVAHLDRRACRYRPLHLEEERCAKTRRCGYTRPLTGRAAALYGGSSRAGADERSPSGHAVSFEKRAKNDAILPAATNPRSWLNRHAGQPFTMPNGTQHLNAVRL
jgi:hypothetical protein